MSNTFDEPVTSSGGAPADLEGNLVVVWPLEYVTEVATQHGSKDATRVHVVDLDEDVEHPDTLWFSGRLIAITKRSIGKRLLGRIVKGTAEKGKQPPWLFESAAGDKAAVTRALKWIEEHPDTPAATQPEPKPEPKPEPEKLAKAQQGTVDGDLDGALAAADDEDDPGF